MSPRARNDDGLLDVCLIDWPEGPGRTLSTVAAVILGKHEGCRTVRSWRCSQLDISSPKSLEYFGDGEIRCRGTDFHVRVLPGALRVIVP